MNLSKIIRHKLSITALILSFLFLAAACGTESDTSTSTQEPVAPTPTPEPAALTPTPEPATPTPTPEPELTLDDLLLSAGEKLATMSTAKFKMIDEFESGSKFFGTTLKSIEGEIKSPDSFRMVVDVVAPGLGFVEIEMMAVGEQAYMKFSRDAPWLPLPLDQVPFNFGGIGVTFSELLPIMKNSVITGQESIGGVQTVRVDGDVLSEDMTALIVDVDPGHPITLTFWFDEDDHTLRKFSIDGQLFNDDAPETRRLLDFSGINVSVDIQLPDVASEQ